MVGWASVSAAMKEGEVEGRDSWDAGEGTEGSDLLCLLLTNALG